MLYKQYKSNIANYLEGWIHVFYERMESFLKAVGFWKDYQKSGHHVWYRKGHQLMHSIFHPVKLKLLIDFNIRMLILIQKMRENLANNYKLGVSDYMEQKV